MSEVTFAKSFLATLDKRPIKLPADHVSDPRKYPNQSPFILPKQTHPFPRTDAPTATQQAQARTIIATLKPMRSGETVTLSSVPLDTSIHELKTQYSTQTGQAVEKVKLLLNRKPAADLKTLKELGVEGGVEFSVMVMGGASSTPAASSPATEKSEPPLPTTAPPAAATVAEGDKMDVDPTPSSEKAELEARGKKSPASPAGGILQTEEFWNDLKGFLTQRLQDRIEGERLAGVFREAWRKR